MTGRFRWRLLRKTTRKWRPRQRLGGEGQGGERQQGGGLSGDHKLVVPQDSQTR